MAALLAEYNQLLATQAEIFIECPAYENRKYMFESKSTQMTYDYMFTTEVEAAEEAERLRLEEEARLAAEEEKALEEAAPDLSAFNMRRR